MDSAKQELSKEMLLRHQFLLPLSILFLSLSLSLSLFYGVFFPSVDRKALLLLCNVILLFITKQSTTDAGSGCSLSEEAATAECFRISGTEEEDAAAVEDGKEEESTSFVIGDDEGVEEDELQEKIEAFIEKVRKQMMREALQSVTV